MSKENEALALYKTLCQTLDNMKWGYTKEEDNFVVRTSAIGKDLSMELYIKIDAERQVMYLKSPMPFIVPASERDKLAKAVIMANYSMLNGSFEYDLSDGYLAFKIVVPYMESLISEKVCHYMIMVSCQMTDKFNDKFMALVDGEMNLFDFESFCKQ
ncbi:MAG: hypothetical protein J1F66_06035 [Clostridiales bacterium]|nr:hypothetical protein [Clostridiales bacterium]